MLKQEFLDAIFPVLTPLSIDPAHPFPFIPNLGFSIVLKLHSLKKNEPMTALLRLPVALKRFVCLPDKGERVRYIALEEVVGQFIDSLFPATPSRDLVHSGLSVTVILKLKKKLKIWSDCLKGP